MDASGSAVPDQTKARADVDRAVADAARAAADARAAQTAARRAEREAAEEATPAAVEQRAAAARQRELGALVPDLSRVERGTLDLKGEQPLFGSALAHRALDAAAAALAKRLTSDNWITVRLLVTSDAELATSDAAYLEVVSGLEELEAAAEELLRATTPQAPTEEFAPAFAAAASIVASALPGVLSLFAAHRAVTTMSATVDDLAAAAAVAGALRTAAPGATIVHDDIRLVPEGAVHRKLAELSRRRQELVARKLELEQTKPDEIEPLGDGDPVANRATAPISMIDSLLAAIDGFIASVRAVPKGGTRSPLTVAALRERLHSQDGDQPGAAAFTHVLFVKGAGGGIQQLVEDRLLRDDRFSVVATAAITYMLVETDGSSIVTAGNTSDSAAGHGRIGEQFELAKLQ